MKTGTDLFDMTGRTALVTGAGQGVGQGIAKLLAAFGANVIVNDFVLDRALAVAEEIKAEGGKSLAVQADVTDFASVGNMFDQAARTFGRVDVLVNNAGNAGTQGSTRQLFWETTPEDWDRWIAVNFHGVLNCSRHAVPGMIEGKWGRLVTIISDAGRAGEGNGLEVYSGAKAGAAGFTRGIARAVGRYGITANCVAISATETPGVAPYLADPDYMKKMLSAYVIRRVGQPIDIAAAVLFLASGAGSWVTGQTYPVNGGFQFGL